MIVQEDYEESAKTWNTDDKDRYSQTNSSKH